MLPILPKSKWVKNSATNFCNACCLRIKPGLFSSNKHHCRYCGNVVCRHCSARKYNHHRICRSCHTLLSAATACDVDASDSEEEEREELSPYNTPQTRCKSDIDISPSGTGLITSPECDREIDDDDHHHEAVISDMDELHLADCADWEDCTIYSPSTAASSSSTTPAQSRRNSIVHAQFDVFQTLPLSEHSERDTIEHELHFKRLLVHGYVRHFWRSLLQFNKSRILRRFPPQFVLELMALWLTVSDSFYEYDTDLNITLQRRPIHQHLRSYRNVNIIQRTREWNMHCYHTFGSDVLTCGARTVWKFKLCGEYNHRQKPCILLGIVEADKVRNFKGEADDDEQTWSNKTQTFNDERNGGYALYTGDWNVYHNDTQGRPFVHQRRLEMEGLEITPNDVIAMELDLTPKSKSKQGGGAGDGGDVRESSGCGILRFRLNGHCDTFANNGVAFDDIDINKSYKLAIGLYLRDKVALFQVV
eukprot:CAMPEP_0202702540 /NCGR_PEP_ID=MMETSP1385-20130828/15506_1 /ASSEMBLY_ACC=CAM_ASM_000861 /TAXON_ID=933848 /ORGANISM="Elphidium margaritaceum" /LENGTH=475 /DNA_ID=CAMNT_0049360203 /DNA_START=68 /DNA_END=1495 /DNA_ORIENTATION=+